MDSKIVKDPEL